MKPHLNIFMPMLVECLEESRNIIRALETLPQNTTHTIKLIKDEKIRRDQIKNGIKYLREGEKWI
jgi:hypothetical protein